MHLIFDLDGTLTDSKRRVYRLFISLTGLCGLGYEEYWDYKYAGFKNDDLLRLIFGRTDKEILEFQNNWFELIESDEYLDFDELIPGIDQTLHRLKNVALLHLCTARQFEAPVHSQLTKWGIDSCFDSILVTKQLYEKEFLISRSIDNLTNRDWMIGDTGKDLLAGKNLGIRTCAVLTGFMGRDKLSIYRPDVILGSVNEIDHKMADGDGYREL